MYFVMNNGGMYEYMTQNEIIFDSPEQPLEEDDNNKSVESPWKFGFPKTKDKITKTDDNNDDNNEDENDKQEDSDDDKKEK